MSDDLNSLHAAFTGISLAATTFIAFIGKRFVGKVDENADKIDTVAAALFRHEKEDVSMYVTVNQLERVHTRIDENTRAVEDNFKETRAGINEIKNILIQGVTK